MNPKSTSNQSSKPCTVLQYPSKKIKMWVSTRRVRESKREGKREKESARERERKREAETEGEREMLEERD